MATVAELLVKIGANSSGLRKELAASQRQIKRAFGPEAMEASSVAVGRAGELMAVLSVAMTGVGVASVKMAASMEQNKIAFETMLGSAESANTFLQQLQSFAEKTPFTFDGLVTGSKRMLAMGFQANEIIPILTTIGDAVAAVGGTADSLPGMAAFQEFPDAGYLILSESEQVGGEDFFVLN